MIKQALLTFVFGVFCIMGFGVLIAGAVAVTLFCWAFAAGGCVCR